MSRGATRILTTSCRGSPHADHFRPLRGVPEAAWGRWFSRRRRPINTFPMLASGTKSGKMAESVCGNRRHESFETVQFMRSNTRGRPLRSARSGPRTPEWTVREKHSAGASPKVKPHGRRLGLWWAERRFLHPLKRRLRRMTVWKHQPLLRNVDDGHGQKGTAGLVAS
ncbi:hypothetical protein BU26DRAFT_68926 [Trematosphaeria pertusa]|uniref:Uncharacterized protein n=1 Tax=Trematosphaeria pertusa TaxID=390896 RepID=A0A6A6I564_9PLEO|nr:uncharacterized protein BU26DRAFT_68926 [Trematosphaeria pertusa]KAF2245466.1 hypothetical protein BU26DRAFT_68926 [Trematosphaeria pertusa]